MASTYYYGDDDLGWAFNARARVSGSAFHLHTLLGVTSSIF
jgi:hypothetical protein